MNAARIYPKDSAVRFLGGPNGIVPLRAEGWLDALNEGVALALKAEVDAVTVVEDSLPKVSPNATRCSQIEKAALGRGLYWFGDPFVTNLKPEVLEEVCRFPLRAWAKVTLNNATSWFWLADAPERVQFDVYEHPNAVRGGVREPVKMKFTTMGVGCVSSFHAGLPALSHFRRHRAEGRGYFVDVHESGSLAEGVGPSALDVFSGSKRVGTLWDSGGIETTKVPPQGLRPPPEKVPTIRELLAQRPEWAKQNGFL